MDDGSGTFGVNDQKDLSPGFSCALTGCFFGLFTGLFRGFF